MAEFIGILREIRGTTGADPVLDEHGELTNAVESGKYGTITSLFQKTTDVQETSAAIQTTMWGTDAVNGSVGTILENVTLKSANVDDKSAAMTVNTAAFDAQFLAIAGVNGLGDTDGFHYNVMAAEALVNPHYTAIDTIDTNIADITAVSANIATVITVNANEAAIIAVDANEANIVTVAGNTANINTVATNAVNIGLVVANETNIDAVAANEVNITAVAGNEVNITAVNANKVNIDSVAANETNITAVNTNKINIDSVAAGLANINAVVVEVNNGSSALNTALANATDAETSKTEAETAAALANQWAEEAEDVEVVAGEYSAMHWAIKAGGYVGQGVIDDDATNTITTYSSSKIEQINTALEDSIAGLATAAGRISTDGAISPIDTADRALPFTTATQSNNSGSFTLDDTTEKITFKTDATYSFMSNVQLTNTNGASLNEIVTISVVDDSDNAVLATEVLDITIDGSSTEYLPVNTLLTVGKNGVPSTSGGDLVVRFEIRSSGTQFELTSFDSIVASSSGYTIVCDAADTTVTPAGNLASTDVQAALEELQTDVDGKTGKDSYSAKTGNYSLVANDYILADSTGGVFTLQLPGSPVMGTYVSVLDVNHSFGSNNVSIDRNGNTIMGVAEDMLLDLDNSFSKFIYTGTDWRLQ